MRESESQQNLVGLEEVHEESLQKPSVNIDPKEKLISNPTPLILENVDFKLVTGAVVLENHPYD